MPGAKILVSGPVTFRRGVLLLTGKNTQILGGYVEDLFERNGSMATALQALSVLCLTPRTMFIQSVSSRSKAAARLEESRIRFDRLNIKLQMQSLLNAPDPSSTAASTTISTANSTVTTITPALPPSSSAATNDEDDMDDFLRQAYADGMFDDDPPLPEPPSPPPPPRPPARVASPPSRPSPRPAPVQTKVRSKEVIIISDEEDHYRCDSYHDELPTIPSVSPVRPAPPSKIIVTVPYTYLSMVRSKPIPTYQTYQDYTVHGCFASLVSNPRLIKNEYELQAYLNDGSDCLLVRLASDLLAQRIGITVNELLTKRQTCKTDVEKQKFQTDFNERLKQFGYRMGQVIGSITVRFLSDNRMPTVISIEEI